jgi:P-type Cu2+ transporter
MPAPGSSGAGGLLKSMPPPAVSAALNPADLSANTLPAAAAAVAPTPRTGQVDAAVGVVDDPLELEAYTRWVVGAQGQRLGESTLQLSGMYCAACAGTIEAALAAVPGVADARVGAAAQRATVRWDPQATQPSALIAAVRRAGYDAVPDAAAPARAMRRAEQRQAIWRLFVAWFCAMQVMMMASPSYFAAPGELAPDLSQLLNWGQWLMTLPVLLFSSTPFFSGAWRGLRQRRIGMEVPVAMGVVIMFVAGTYSTFQPEGLLGAEVYFDSLTMFVGFLLGARWLEMRERHRAAEQLEASLGGLPETAQRLRDDGSTETVSVRRLQPGDRVRVPLGQAFPADGVLLQGHTQADEALLTGESLPQAKAEGDEVVAGSVNLGAPVLMQVQRAGADTRFEAIVALMRSALTQRPAAARLADRWATPFLIAVITLAFGGALVWSFIDPARAVWVAVAVLIVTCPCALSLAVPSTLVAATRGLARRGVMMQRLDALEPLAHARQVFLDKTGTLTEDRPQLAAVQPTAQGQGLGTAQLHATAAALAVQSAHPLSVALHAAWAATGDPAPAGPVLHAVQELAGRGVEGRDAQGAVWRLGQAAWVGGDAPTGDTDDDGGPVVWLSRDGVPLAVFHFEETLREDAAAAVQALRAQGLRVRLLSGDAPARALAMAARLGLDDAVGGASPEDKLAALAAAQAEDGPVVMVGDGVNDAPVLARADVSLAMGQGALVSRSQADAVIVSNRLTDLVAARRTAQRSVYIARQNMAWAASYNAVCIPLALVGWLPPWAAGLGMALSSVLVMFNALRAAR